MSTDTNVLLDLGADFAGTVWLANTLGKGVPALDPVVERWRHAWLPQRWSVDRPGRIFGPGGFAIDLDAQTASFYHVMRWSLFCHDATLRDPLRAALRAIGELLGSTRAIYHHELLPSGTGSLDEREQQLRAQFGPPAETFEQLAAVDLWTAGCWYLEPWR